MNDVDMIEQIARRLCEADGYDPDIIGTTGNPRWWLYATTAGHMLPILAEAWDEGHGDGYDNAMREPSIEYGTRKRITNPYRKEQDA